MTLEQLIAEGRKLQRPCLFLHPEGSGLVAAVWYERDPAEIERTGHRCWLTVDSRQVPGWPSSDHGYLSIYTDERVFKGGHVEVSPSWPHRAGLPLYAEEVSVLPPTDAVFARGSSAVGEWLHSCGWDRAERYNDNFQGRRPGQRI